ncbi:MAG: PilC/PilY family type IV pilus protein [Methylococcaceae bacterium]|nr:PilC/PilY family type IV pilus protein [Methylococcaceae bacterium]MDZ4156926.1 PilC/PilY family type IV pilus protein [Methylococcales bacterium]MDP2394026.1 PilC/PilY family type IV pilus protein [Methylococcaceae bacterium]MDP3018510.1 PilC/PilY family type IV pilus protein [Methylococcaceae bacterium]MDP3390964.1 PilC/PilY family type IV pilus protein [Methylococcaceae bacterium]
MKSKTSSNFYTGLAGLIGCWLALLSAPANAVIVLPNAPLGVSTSAKPMTMITAGKDHKLFYEAYNDASDIDGDGTLDIRFKPSITYYGLFDSKVCYSYDNNLFSPAAATSDGKCSNQWSGNWLNYITTSRIDALRKVLYGGFREVDSTTQTILRRAYIPGDAHSWAKEYTSATVDGYKITDYTPLSQPGSGKRHFIGNLTNTAGINCSTLSNCSNLAPLLKIRKDVGDNRRVWEWASKERPVLQNKLSDGPDTGTGEDDFPSGSTVQEHTVRVEVCTTSYHDGCKQYSSNFKPVGLLHDYGENDSMLFGLITGSYNKNMSGGVLRKVVSSFSSEVNTTTGQFTANNTIVKSFDNLRIRDFNNGRTDNAYRGGWVTTRAMNQGEFVDWGNPIAEMMYESLRYFAGKAAATSEYDTSGSYDGDIGLTTAAWDNPYNTTTSAAKAPWCAKPNMLVVSDINPSFDSDQLPGSYSTFGSFTGDVTDLDVKTLADTITSNESDITGNRFIGQSGTTFDGAPTAKNVTSLGTIRGLSPEEPTKQGSYYSASVAYFGKIKDLNSADNKQSVDSFYVALASPLPRIQIPTANGQITLVPFAKSVAASNTKGQFQSTDQIVDFYVETIANSGSTTSPDYDLLNNGGRYHAKFIINYEDVEQGADHDMDAIAEYEVRLLDTGKVQVKVTPTYEAGGDKQNMGYIISGTTKDGVYLVVQDENFDRPYFLNTPPDLDPGACDASTPPAACSKLPYTVTYPGGSYSNREFTAGSSSAATLLKDPLWYAAKWGGFVDKNNNNLPDLTAEWDADNNGVPDTYFLVQNPLKLKETLKRTLDNIIERSASAGNVTSNSTAINTDTKVFQSLFNSASWSGNLLAYTVSTTGISATPSWQAADHVPAPDDRKIFTSIGGAAKEFKWSALSTGEQSTLTSFGASENIVNYLRGDRTNELQNSGSLRNRTTNVLGDIVHSSPYFVKDTNTVYVGANDGMLHAFNATTGTELFGYIPSQSLSRLKNLSKTDYGSSTNPHDYFVDGDIAVSTLAQTPGHNYLVASLGQGGKGLFALDVASPASFGASHVLWEYPSTSDNNLGLMLGRPIIAKMNDGTMAVIIGNGYNSTNGKAVLYIFNLATGALLKSIDTLAGGDNGLATPGVFDSDGDGKIDWIYAGDLKGNVWKFDVRGAESDHSTWAVGLSGLPLFVAKNSSNQLQPITAQINVAVNTSLGDPNSGKRFVFFGTGSYFRTGDPNNVEVQSWYGLIDDDVQITDRTVLRLRTVLAEGTVSSKQVRTFSEASANDMVGKKGWYFDLTKANGTAEGERMVTSSKVYALAEPTLIASSIIPVIDPCVPGGKGYVNAISPFTGARLGKGFFDLNRNGNFNDDKLASINIGAIDFDVGMPSESVLIGNLLVVCGSSGECKEVPINLGAGGSRISWREIFKK